MQKLAIDGGQRTGCFEKNMKGIQVTLEAKILEQARVIKSSEEIKCMLEQL